MQRARKSRKRAEHGIANASGNAGLTATPQSYLLYTEYSLEVVSSLALTAFAACRIVYHALMTETPTIVI